MGNLYAQEPIFVVTFWWGGIGFGLDPNSPYVKYCTSYAYREITSDEFPITNGFAYGFLKSLTGFDTAIQIDGFGQVNQLSAEFVDYFGHFRYWMASRNIYTEIMVEVGLFFRDPNSTPDQPLKGTIYKVFEGKIRETVIWNEADRTFKCDFVSDTWFKNIGYTPALENVILQRFIPDPPIYNTDGQIVNGGAGTYEPQIDTERTLLQQNINANVWPQLFGRALDIPMTPLAKTPEFTVEMDVPCTFGWGRNFKGLVREAYVENASDLNAIFDNAALVIPLDKNDQFFMAVQRDYVDFNYLWPPTPQPGIPYYQPILPEQTVILNNYQSMFPGIPAKMMVVDIESEGETIRCAGYLIDRFFVVPEMQYFNMPISEGSIAITKIHQCYENPDFIIWQDYNSPGAIGKLTPTQQAFAAGPAPPQWVDRPDYEPNMLQLKYTKVVVDVKTGMGGNTLTYHNYYPPASQDELIRTGWYFSYDGSIYVVIQEPIPGGTVLTFSPALPTKLTIEIGTQLEICPPDTPWLQNQFIAINVHFKWPTRNTTQAKTPEGDLLYIENSNLTINSKDRYGNLNLPYYEVSGYTERDDILYARVVTQLGPNLFIENMVNVYNMDASKWLMSPNTSVSFITAVTGSLRLMPRSMDMRIFDTAQAAKNMNQMADQRRLQYVVSETTTVYAQKKYNKIAASHLIRANAKMRVVDWWASHTYVLTTEIGQPWEFVYPATIQPWYFRVYIENLCAQVNGRPVPLLGPKSGQGLDSPLYPQYRRNDYFELRRVLLFISTTREVSEMHEYYDGIYYPTRESQLLNWPNHVSITLYPTPFALMLQALAANNQQVELKADAFNTLNSDEKIFKAVLENHTAYFYGECAALKTSYNLPYDPQQLTFEHQAMGIITESMDAREFLAKLAWENAKHIQIRGQYAMLVDFFKMYNPMIIFDADNIDAKSISLEYVPFENLITQYNTTMTNDNRWVIKAPTPFGPFDYSPLKNYTIGRDLDSWKPKDIQILLNQTFRPDDFNMDEPLFDGYITLDNLYPQYLAAQKADPLSTYPVSPPDWVLTMPLWPVEWCERTINSVLHWWLHYESRVWTIMTFRTYVDEGNQSFYLRAGDLVAINLTGPTVKLFEDEQPPVTPGGPALISGYPMERINGTATDFDHSKLQYYSMNLNPAPGQKWCSGLALVLSTNLDPEEWLITVKVLLPITPEGTY